jgi:type I restriction enzyme S subunit
MKWENKKFIDFIQLQRGHDLTREQFIDGPYPVVSSTSIMGYHNQYKADGPGVVIGRSGTLGKAQYINDNYWPHNTTLYVKDYKGNYPRFVYYFLMNFSTDKHGGGSAVPTLNRNTLSSISIRVPDFTTQKRIADILSAYDDLIENNQKQIKLLEEAAMWLYKEWFVKLRFPGHEKTKIEDGVPEGWKLTRVKRMGQVITGKTPSTAIVENYGEDIPFVKIPDMHGVIYPLKTEVKLSERGANTQKNKFLPPKSIMVSCIATVGLVCITHEVCCFRQ